jgi:predicted RNA-binding protein YlxR (DUF448 family)
MSARKTPLRKCIACNEMKPKKELVRVVKNKENEVSVDLTGKANGRGAYICPTIDCFEEAYRNKKFQRALQTEITEEIYARLKNVIDK